MESKVRETMPMFQPAAVSGELVGRTHHICDSDADQTFEWPLTCPLSFPPQNPEGSALHASGTV